MKKIGCIGLLFLVLAGCQSGIPGNIIQPDKMAAVLYDIHVTDGYISSIPQQDSAKIIAAAYYKGVYTKFGIDSARYTTSMNYYFTHPDVLSGIYDKVTKGLQKSKDSLDKINEKALKIESDKRVKAAKKTADSLARIRAKMKPADIKKAKADSLQKVKTDSLKRVKTNKRISDSLAKVHPKPVQPLSIKKVIKSSSNNSLQNASDAKPLITTKKSMRTKKLNGGKTTVEVN